MAASETSSSADSIRWRSRLRQVATNLADFSRPALQHVDRAMRDFMKHRWNGFVKWTRMSLSTGDIRAILLPNGGTMQMIYCSPGTFLMGLPKDEEGRSADEEQHEVRIANGFWLGKYAVTQEQWKSVMGNNPSRFKGDLNPVENVSYRDCKEFIHKINASLNCGARFPTEAEWEYACRAGTTTSYNWGNRFKRDKANCKAYSSDGSAEKTTRKQTTPVGQFKANDWGFHDMHGNVWEWVLREYRKYRIMYPGDSRPWNDDKEEVLCGGGWASYAESCRSTSRISTREDASSSEYGFRLCCDGGRMNEYFEKTLHDLSAEKYCSDCSVKC